MRERHGNQNRNPESGIPPELARDLAGRFGRSVPVPPEVDRKIVARARYRFERRRRTRLIVRWAAAASAVAASILLAALLVPRMYSPAPEAPGLKPAEREPAAAGPSHQVAVLREDFDGNGTVNIVDAFLLARRIKTSGRLKAVWDINGDGTVNRSDADAIAKAAVKVEGG